MAILIVEDNKASARFMEIMLQKDDHQTVMAYDAEMALEILADRTDIELIIADIVMPKVDGLELIKEIRKNPAWADIQIIMCSALRCMKTIKKAVSSGCNHYMIKPIKKPDLLKKIQEALGTEAA
jgi:CheY-like chemotaxis protein